MVSPGNQGIAASGQQDKNKYPLAFGRYRFYLDIKSIRAKAGLITDILALGGRIEEFLIKEVTHIITDAPEWKFPPISGGNPLGPPSPWTPTPPTPSPGASNSLDGVDRGKKAKSRVDTILAAARNPNKSGSSDVLEVARRLNCQTWSFNKTLAWLAKFKAKYKIPSLGAQPVQSQVRELKAPYVKLENILKFSKPVFLELKAWPRLYYQGRVGSSPFSSSRLKNKRKQFVKRLDVERPKPKSPVQKDVKKGGGKKKRGGFCEICNKNYSELDTHLVSDTHKVYVEDSRNWERLDKSSRNKPLHQMLL